VTFPIAISNSLAGAGSEPLPCPGLPACLVWFQCSTAYGKRGTYVSHMCFFSNYWRSMGPETATYSQPGMEGR